MRKNNFKDRLEWLIETFGKGKPFVFAKKIGIKSGTFQSYLKGRVPQADQLICFRRILNVNLNWLLTGDGNPIESQVGPHGNVECVDTEKADLLHMASEVLNSKGSYSVSLAANIRSFHEAVSTAIELAALKTDQDSLREEVAELRRYIRLSSDRTRKEDPPEKKQEIIKQRAISSG